MRWLGERMVWLKRGNFGVGYDTMMSQHENARNGTSTSFS
jgi:hypothetical protein